MKTQETSNVLDTLDIRLNKKETFCAVLARLVEFTANSVETCLKIRNKILVQSKLLNYINYMFAVLVITLDFVNLLAVLISKLNNSISNC